MPTTTIYLIRHAQSNHLAKCSHADRPLSQLGRQQAVGLADLLAPLGIERIYSSPYPRALDTMGPFAARSGLDIVPVDDLREMRMVIGDDDFSATWRRLWDDFDYCLPSCETAFDAQRRFVRAAAEIRAGCAGRTIAICAHGAVIGLYLHHLDPAFGREEAEVITTPDVMRIAVEDGRLSWDEAYRLDGLSELGTSHAETPAEEGE